MPVSRAGTEAEGGGEDVPPEPAEAVSFGHRPKRGRPGVRPSPARRAEPEADAQQRCRQREHREVRVHGQAEHEHNERVQECRVVRDCQQAALRPPVRQLRPLVQDARADALGEPHAAVHGNPADPPVEDEGRTRAARGLGRARYAPVPPDAARGGEQLGAPPQLLARGERVWLFLDAVVDTAEGFFWHVEVKAVEVAQRQVAQQYAR